MTYGEDDSGRYNLCGLQTDHNWQLKSQLILVSWHMEALDLQITESARAVIEDFLSAYEADATLGLNFEVRKTYTLDGAETNERITRWRSVAISKAQAYELDKQSEVLGTQGLYLADGLTICLFEPHDVERLRGKILDAKRGKLFVRERAS